MLLFRTSVHPVWGILSFLPGSRSCARFFLPWLYVDHFFSGISSASQTLHTYLSPLNNSAVMEQFLFPRTAAGRLNDFKFRSAASFCGLPIHFQRGRGQDWTGNEIQRAASAAARAKEPVAHSVNAKELWEKQN